MKKNAGAQNDHVIEGLEQTLRDFEQEILLLKKTINDEKTSRNLRNVLKPEEIFLLVGDLYHLRINGPKIREQVDGLKLAQENTEKKRENHLKLPAKANTSTIMLQFRNSVDPKETVENKK